MTDLPNELLSKIRFSISEERGINSLTEKDLKIYCPGISTFGVAEMRMAMANSKRKIIATTIDKAGYKETKTIVAKYNLGAQIKVKFEDLLDETNYSDKYFDFIYARLVLHYLNDNDLKKVLCRFFKMLKKGGRLFVVVKSVNDWQATSNGSTFDSATGLTAFKEFDTDMKETGKIIKRRFHSEKSIKTFLINSGFSVKYSKEYDEQLFNDFMRKIRHPKLTSVIEVMASK